VARVLEKPQSSLLRSLEALVREPVDLLVVPPEDEQYWGVSPLSSPRASCTSGGATAQSLTSSSFESTTESLASPPGSGISQAETKASSQARSWRPGKEADVSDMNFTVSMTVDEVWRRVRAGEKQKDICKLLSDTRKHLVSRKVKLHRGGP